MVKRFWLIFSRDIYDEIFFEVSYKKLECFFYKNRDRGLIFRFIESWVCRYFFVV